MLPEQQIIITAHKHISRAIYLLVRIIYIYSTIHLNCSQIIFVLSSYIYIHINVKYIETSVLISRKKMIARI